LNSTLDTVVIGGGAMGSAAAWALAKRGRDVTVLEQFGPGHLIGASHGTTRNLSLACSEPDYVVVLAEALRLWSELETESGEQLLARTGVVNHGPDPQLGAMHAALNSAGLRADFLPTAASGSPWTTAAAPRCLPPAGRWSPPAAGRRSCSPACRAYRG
jgi:sarcosine oxidase